MGRYGQLCRMCCPTTDAIRPSVGVAYGWWSYAVTSGAVGCPTVRSRPTWWITSTPWYPACPMPCSTPHGTYVPAVAGTTPHVASHPAWSARPGTSGSSMDHDDDPVF